MYSLPCYDEPRCEPFNRKPYRNGDRTAARSVIHPRSHPVTAQPRGKSKSAGAHRKVTDEVPHKTDDLNNHGKRGKDEVLNLCSK